MFGLLHCAAQLTCIERVSSASCHDMDQPTHAPDRATIDTCRPGRMTSRRRAFPRRPIGLDISLGCRGRSCTQGYTDIMRRGTCVVGPECDTEVSTIGLNSHDGIVQSSKPEFEPPTREAALDTITFGDALVRSRSDNRTNDVAASDIAQIGGGHGEVNPLRRGTAGISPVASVVAGLSSASPSRLDLP
jgi:hypothetical protein